MTYPPFPTAPSTPTVGDRVASIAFDLLGPVDAPHGSSRRRLLTARRVCAVFGVLATLVQIVVWLLIAVLTGRLDSPWWLWTTAPAAVAVLTLGFAASLTGEDR